MDAKIRIYFESRKDSDRFLRKRVFGKIKQEIFGELNLLSLLIHGHHMEQMLSDRGKRRYNRGKGRHNQGESGVVVGITADGAVISSGRC